MQFHPEKDDGLIPHVLSQILDTCVNGITLSDPDQPDNPIVYANEAFARMTGYGREETIGRNCRFLQGDDRDQEGIARIREAVREQRSVEVTLRNYRKDGTRFYNRLAVHPLFDRKGHLIYFLGVQYDITATIEAEAEVQRLNAVLEGLRAS